MGLDRSTSDDGGLQRWWRIVAMAGKSGRGDWVRDGHRKWNEEN